MTERMEDYRLEVGSTVWSNIESELKLKPEKRRKGGALWIASSVIGLILVITSYAYDRINNYEVKSDIAITSALDDSNTEVHPEKFVEQPQASEASSEAVQSDLESGSNIQTVAKTYAYDQLALISDSPSSAQQVSKNSDLIQSLTIPSEEEHNTNNLDQRTTASQVDPLSTLPAFEFAPSLEKNISRQAFNNPLALSDNYAKWQIKVHGGVGMSYRQLNSHSSHQLVEHRNQHEKSSMAYQVGIAGFYRITKRSAVGVGIGYAEYSEGYAFHHDTIQHETRNKYDYIQLNAYYRHTVIRKNRFELSVLGGAKFGRLHNAESSWVNPSDLQAVAHSSETTQGAFTKWTTAGSLAIDAEFKATRHLSIHLQPTFDAFLNSCYTQESTLHQRPYALLLDLGLSYNF